MEVPWTIEAEIQIPAVLRSAKGPVLTVGGTATMVAGSGQLSVKILSIDPCSVLEVRWMVMVDPADVLPGGPVGVLNRVVGGRPQFESLYVLVLRLTDLWAELAALTGDSLFFEAWRNHEPATLFRGPATLTFNGSHDKFTVDGTHLGYRTKVQSLPLLRTPSPTQVAAVLASPDLRPSDLFLLRADIARRESRFREFVVDLVTALETRAYEIFRRKNPKKEPPFFAPKTYCSNPATLGATATLDQTNSTAYEHLCMLWGTRHEFVHNGKMMVRAYDAANKKDDPDPTKARPFQATPDTNNFLHAVWATFDWFDGLP